jgi:hypothetical protein
MNKEEQSKISAILTEPIACRVLRTLIYCSAQPNAWDYGTDGLTASALAKHISYPEEQVRQILGQLLDVGLVEYSVKADRWNFANNQTARPLIDKAIFEFELNFVRERCRTTNYHAEEKITAIDELASHIAVARLDVRS